jgi:hypothetical protein
MMLLRLCVAAIFGFPCCGTSIADTWISQAIAAFSDGLSQALGEIPSGA